MPSDQHSNGARVLVVAAFGALLLAACGGGGPNIASRVHQSASTTTTAIPSTTTAPTTSTTAVPANLQRVTYNGLALEVPKDWPVYNLATDQSRCVRLDVHALYLGQEGQAPQCPAHVLGHTDTAQIEPLNARVQGGDAAVATKPDVLNGLSVRVDPNPTTSGAFTIVFPDLQLVAIVTIGDTPALAQQIVSSFQHAG
jgi:hypothetical protein